MKKIMSLLFCLVTCFVVLAERRGETFEKNGLVYTIADECVLRNHRSDRDLNCYRDLNGIHKIDTHSPDTIYHYTIIRNEGDVFVSGITFSDRDSVVTIPSVVYMPSTLNRKDTTIARYNVLGIGEKAFEGAKLKDLIIPGGLKFIGKEAFHNLELTNGTFVLPSLAKTKIKENVFDGMKARVFFSDLILVEFENTFQNLDVVPECYTIHSCIGWAPKHFYSVGMNIYGEWISQEELKNRAYIPVAQSTGARNSHFFDTFEKDPLFRGDEKIIAPSFKIRTVKKFDKYGTDIDMLPPYEYESRNTYTGKREVYQEFTMDRQIYRCRKDTVYYYFTTDGKPITEKESLIDDDGRDPFGMQVRSPEEMKAKKAAKEREQNLNNKINQMKSMFGF